MQRVARETGDFLIEDSANNGIRYWDTVSSGLTQLGDWRSRPVEFDNPAGPVDSSAAGVAALGGLLTRRPA